jgi:hypothetical protein
VTVDGTPNRAHLLSLLNDGNLVSVVMLAVYVCVLGAKQHARKISSSWAGLESRQRLALCSGCCWAADMELGTSSADAAPKVGRGEGWLKADLEVHLEYHSGVVILVLFRWCPSTTINAF